MRHPHTSFDGPPRWLSAEVRALALAVLLFAGLVGFIGACGSGDLVFPGQTADTPTVQFTATNTPVATATPLT
jgi:hypothetical protein